ncbi:Epstein-Barr virus EBNA-1-like [Oryza sativa Japonica Group]|uniref:Epstein-Barr virus EBNA-1-like n=1 Tax=Oryza sativa subsp. japonica TaxID=39947 RepID=Q8S9Q7_ORYSJ|nr:Epstein-Barr virus EBNA-1-like [Oryza sativa Japonica Group]
MGQQGGDQGDSRERGGERDLTRGEPTAADFDGDRRRRAKGENFTGATGVRFVGAGASTRGRELILPVERARATPREAGDGERRPGQSKGARRDVTNGGGRGAARDKGKGVQWGAHRRENGVGGADGVAARRTRRRGGAAPRGRGRGRRDGEVRGWGGAELLVDSSCSLALRHARRQRRARTTTNGEAAVVWRCRFERTDIGAVKEMRQVARAVKRHRGGDAGGGRGKGKRRGKGAWSLAIMRRGRVRRRRRGRAAASPTLGRVRRGVAGAMDDVDDDGGGRFGMERGQGGSAWRRRCKG